MYEFVFRSQLTTAVAGLALLLLACSISSKARFWWRIIGINYGPVLAAGFMAAILLSDRVFSFADVVAALIFEFVILCIFCRLVFTAYQSLHSLTAPTVQRAVAVCAALYLASFAPAALSGGFGIFSAGTRIDYLYESSAAKYFTYAGVMLSAVLAGLLARRITINSRPRLLDYLVILSISATSVLAGSKGGFILWILSIMALVDYRQARIRTRTIAVAAGGVSILVVILAVVVSDFLRLSTSEFFDLAFSRFFLNNDARALAFDLRRLEVPPGVSLWSEAFRSLSTLFGSPPHNSPLGVELYDSYFGPSGGAGANASLVGMVMLYTAPGDAALPLVLASLLAFGLLLASQFATRHMPTKLACYSIQMLAMIVVTGLSQDFLALQVVLPMTVVVGLFFYVSGSVQLVSAPKPRQLAE